MDANPVTLSLSLLRQGFTLSLGLMLWPDISPAEPSNLLVFVPTVLGIFKCATVAGFYMALVIKSRSSPSCRITHGRRQRSKNIREQNSPRIVFYNGLSLSKRLEPL